MKPRLVLLSSVAWITSIAAVAQTGVQELETRVLSGKLSAEAAISEYCSQESSGKSQDAFCSCPEEALRLLEERLKSHRTNSS